MTLLDPVLGSQRFLQAIAWSTSFALELGRVQQICSLGFTGYCSAAALEFFPRPNSKTGLPTLINREQLNARSPCQMETFISNTSARGTRIVV